MPDNETAARPIVLITGAAGDIGRSLTRALRRDYFVVGVDLVAAEEADASYEIDLTSSDSVRRVLDDVATAHGRTFAAVIHLAAYFDFSGEHSPLYEKVNVGGTRNLLEALQAHEVERFIYSSTMLVHAPARAGGRIDEDSPLGPRWVYPQSKADSEAAIEVHAGNIPYTLLRLAGLYDDMTAVPTLAQQIARIYERNYKSHLFSGDMRAGQAFVHKEDMIDAFVRVIEKRRELPRRHALLIGEARSESYEALQNRIGELVHGEREWRTFVLPGLMAKAGAWLEEKTEPLIPDDFDHGEKPFIRPFMIDLASDHYELDISRAQHLLGWRPRHAIMDGLEALIANLKADPAAWYRANKITPPDWIDAAAELGEDVEAIRRRHESAYAAEHQRHLWAHLLNVALGFWLITSPAILGYASLGMTVSDIGAGIVLIVLASLSLSPRFAWARWATAVVGLWLMFAPLVFWSTSAAAYLNGTLVGMLVIGFAALARPAPGISPVAALTGPVTPPGWNNNPSAWFQRLPIIALAFVGFFISRYLAAYQLGHIEAAWDPFFGGLHPGRTGTEDVITSDVSEAWPIPDAGLGGIVYALEILVGLLGAAERWRTMPWVVALFAVMIVPLGIVSITFIIIQPIIIGTWCALCLMAAGAMLLQIAYAANEFVATGQFLGRRRALGRPALKIFFVGDTESAEAADLQRQNAAEDDFRQSPMAVLRASLGTGVSVPWNLALCILIGVWLMFTRVTLGHDGALANWDHLVGALVITIATIALGEVVRTVRYLVVPLALLLFVTPFAYSADGISIVASFIAGAALIALCLRRGPVRGDYGTWNGKIV
jgi:nucleoside-diphosphate-sugar epimerase/uncharacterized membrane protein